MNLKFLSLFLILFSASALSARAGRMGISEEFSHDAAYALGGNIACTDEEVKTLEDYATKKALEDCQASLKYAICSARTNAVLVYNSPQRNASKATCQVHGYADGIRY